MILLEYFNNKNNPIIMGVLIKRLALQHVNASILITR
jgi:hypothetical protein